MPLLVLQQITHAYGHHPLLDGADLQVEPGERVALIGRNGSGKSTLLRIAAGELAPDAGRVWLAPGARAARLDQEVPAEIQGTVRDAVAGGLPSRDGHDEWTWAHQVDIVLTQLSLPADRPVQELSGGWRRRVMLGRALVSNPELLLLDEPTNHLDIDAIAWLEDFIRGFAGALIFVTHDRAFLRGLATRVVELDRGRLLSWQGSYDQYLERKAAALDAEERELERLDRKLAEEEAWLRRGIKARRTRNEGRVRALMALREERAARRARSGNVRMALEAGEASGRLVFEARDVTCAYGDHVVLTGLTTRILRGDRVGLIGPNGSGKTTALRVLLGEIEPQAGEVRQGARLQVAYFDQERLQLDPEKTVAANVSDGDMVTVNGRSRHVIGYLADFLFPRERALSPVKALSGGERNRLLLARLFARPANVLVLDEPTNDLDIETLELLEELIADFDGTVLLVTHDRAFLDNVVTSTLAFEPGGHVTEYVGGWQDYLRQARARAAGESSSREQAARSAARADAGRQASRQERPRRRSYKEAREYEALPQRIEALEQEQQALQQEMAGPDFYKSPPERIREVLARVEAIQHELDEALARWIALEEIAP